MKLYFSPPSPFSRKVRIVLAVTGQSHATELVATDTLNPDDPIRQKNPLGKIPALERDDGFIVFDSAVIVEWLDALAGGGVAIPVDPEQRLRARTLEALADGLTDACILQVYETRLRAAHERSENFLAHQRGKVARALAALEAAPPALDIHVGTIATACALGYLDLRFDGLWRADHPRLAAWLEAFARQLPAFAETAP